MPDLSLRVPAGFAQSLRLLRRLKPRLLFATGGFVALPPALAARAPPHPGGRPRADGGAGTGQPRRRSLRAPGRADLPAHERRRSRRALGAHRQPAAAGAGRGLRGRPAAGSWASIPAQPIVYVTGGSQGSHKINRTVGEVLAPTARAHPARPSVWRPPDDRRPRLAREARRGAAPRRAQRAATPSGPTSAPSSATSRRRRSWSWGEAGRAR